MFAGLKTIANIRLMVSHLLADKNELCGTKFKQF